MCDCHYCAELLATLVKDFAPVQSKYLAFGVQLGVPMDKIESFKLDCHYDTGSILHQIFHYWLCNTPKELWFTKLCAALEHMDQKGLVSIVKKNYMKEPSQGASKISDSMAVLLLMNKKSYKI